MHCVTKRMSQERDEAKIQKADRTALPSVSSFSARVIIWPSHALLTIRFQASIIKIQMMQVLTGYKTDLQLLWAFHSFLHYMALLN